ncbi:MAG TPA: FkbM family methyltransferase [Longimicrobiaceae bacterium]|nr:FkbM family methyltransferase [Longimicrobiaceae bacterium]
MTTSFGTVTREYEIGGVRLLVRDFEFSGAVEHIVGELRSDQYGLGGIPFREGDVVLDVGGHVGLFSMYLARLHPEVVIYAYEPVPDNYRHLLWNLEANGITSVRAFNRAVSGDGKPLRLTVHFGLNSAGATAHGGDDDLPGSSRFEVESVTLDGIFREHGIDRCRLLKIDCEGAEYEILFGSGCLHRVDHLSGEFHLNAYLASRGYSPERLYRHCARFIRPEHIRYTVWNEPFTQPREPAPAGR